MLSSAYTAGTANWFQTHFTANAAQMVAGLMFQKHCMKRRGRQQSK